MWVTAYSMTGTCRLKRKVTDHWSLGARGRAKTTSLSPKAFVQAILPPLP